MSSAIPVLIVGAGPAGLILALALSINGVTVRLVDREQTYRVGSKGAGIMPRSMELYRHLGVWDDIQAVSLPVPLSRKYGSDGKTVIQEWYFTESYAPTPDCPYLTPCSLDQDALERILRENLKRRFGVVVELGTEVVNFEQSKDNVVVHLKKLLSDQNTFEEETVHAQYLVGTDGGRSTVRKQLGLTFLGETRTQDCLIYGDAVIKGLDDKYWHLFGNDADKFIFVRSPGQKNSDRWAFIAGGRKVEEPDSLGHDAKALEQFIRDTTHRQDIEITRWDYHTSHRLNIRMVDAFGKGGRVFVAGDAAHTHSPTGGQGLNSSVQDAFNLGWKLALVLKGLSSPKLLETYTEERLPVIAEMLGRTTAILNEMAIGERAKNMEEDTGPWRRGRVLYQLGVNYEWSSIVFDDRRDGGRAPTPEGAYIGGLEGLWAGDRAPDAPALRVLNAKEKTPGEITLFDTFRAAKHTILLFVKEETTLDDLQAFLTVSRQQPAGVASMVLIYEKEPESPQVVANGNDDVAVIDTDGHAFRAYAVSDKLRVAVVRPDGVIGAMVGSAEGLSHYLGLVFDV